MMPHTMLSATTIGLVGASIALISYIALIVSRNNTTKEIPILITYYRKGKKEIIQPVKKEDNHAKKILSFLEVVGELCQMTVLVWIFYRGLTVIDCR